MFFGLFTCNFLFDFLPYLAFRYFEYERTRRRSFQKHVVRTKLDIYVFIGLENKVDKVDHTYATHLTYIYS